MTIDDSSNRRTSPIIGISIVIIVIIAVIGIWITKSKSSNDQTRQVTYVVEATGGYAQIIYTASNGENTEAQIYTTPFSRTFTMPIGQKVFLTASNPTQTGDVSCVIKINNRDWKECHGTHPVDSVACGGFIR